VVQALLPLIRRDVEKPTKHAIAFLETRVDLVRAAAEAATMRWKEGKQLGVLDGVPVAIKDEMDLKGYKRCNGTLRDYTSKGNHTSWCVRKLEDEGAVIVGKLNMHELGLGISSS
jgi:Asp-tRNA(Asn)/Glu-tRNA(Gln) amidotransferase A subunit family amidase